jgi:glycosyltransferase involved in cell wall biosynthesis
LSARLAQVHRRDPIDLVISSSSASVKGIRVPSGVPHLCYCHSPARYLWGRGGDYAAGGAAGSARGLGLRLFGPALRRWDRNTAANVSRFIANSAYTAAEIRRCYARDAVVVHPPVRTDFFSPAPTVRREDFWLVAGALEPYKRTDLAIAAARLAQRRLVVAGSGSQLDLLRRGAGPGVEFRGRVSDEALRDLFRRAELLLFPPVEDFGIIPVEAQACGLPVVARRLGGALDSVIPGVTGSLFDEPTPESIVAAALQAPRDADARCRRNAERFSEDAFDAGMLEQIEEILGRDHEAPGEEPPDA